MTPRRRDCAETCSHCFYCEMPIAGRHEHDHFPLPVRHGGDLVVPACLNCHDLKDRIPLTDWPPEDLAAAIMELPPRGRLLLAKLVSYFYDHEQQAT